MLEMKKKNLAILGVLAVLALAFIGVASISATSDASEGSPSNPVGSVSCTAQYAYNNAPFYVAQGGSVYISATSTSTGIGEYYVISATSGYGLSVDGSGNLSGTLSVVGTQYTVSIVIGISGSSTTNTISLIGIYYNSDTYNITITMEKNWEFYKYRVGSGSWSSYYNQTRTFEIPAGSTVRITWTNNLNDTITCTAIALQSYNWERTYSSVTPVADTTYYPAYSLSTASLSYDANGGSGAPATQSGQYASNTGGYTFTISSTAPTWNAHTFAGWSESSTATTAGYQPGDSITVLGNTTIFAVWTTTTIEITWDANGGVIENSQGTDTDTITHTYAQYGETVTPIPDSRMFRNGYVFTGWYTDAIGGTQITTVTATANVTYYAHWALNTIEITWDANGGVIENSQGTDTDTITHTYAQYGETVTPIPDSRMFRNGYNFTGWYTESVGGTQVTSIVATENVTYYAHWSLIPGTVGATHWSNGMYNGKIDLVFQFQPDSKDHVIAADLYTGIVNATDVTNWIQSGYSLNITQSYSPAVVTAVLKYNSTNVTDAVSVNLGNWSHYQLTLDTENSKIYATPVQVWNSFVDYTLYESQKKVILDYSSVITNKTIKILNHDDTGTGTSVARFSVASTDVFLETYGVVLQDPSINVYDYFPQYESVRLNFYSFALYGSSMTVNGQTYPLNGSKVSVNYVTDDQGNHYIPSMMPGATARSKTMDLNNIYVTWDSRTMHCLLTFNSDRFTIDLGAFTPTDKTVTFSGMWYFTTALYEPTISHERELGEWETLPNLDINQMLLIFMAFLGIVGAIAYRTLHGSIFDTVIIGMAFVVAAIMLGS